MSLISHKVISCSNEGDWQVFTNSSALLVYQHHLHMEIRGFFSISNTFCVINAVIQGFVLMQYYSNDGHYTDNPCLFTSPAVTLPIASDSRNKDSKHSGAVVCRWCIC